MSDKLLAAREYYIDVLKGMAMLAVILVHFNNAWNAPIGILNKASAIGARCPQLFFIISAYLTWTALDKRPVGHIEFLKKRYKRMAPLYCVSLVTAVLIPTFKVFNISLGNYISHIVFLNGLNPKWCNGIIGVEWYIANLALFYLMVPCLRKLITNLNTAVIAFLASAVISSGVLVIVNHVFSAQMAENNAYEAYFHTSFIVYQIPVLIVGIILYYLIKEIAEGKISRCLAVDIFGLAAMATSIGFVVLHLNKRYMTSSLIAGLLFGLLFLLCSGIDNKFFAGRVFKPFIFVGKHSYGIYCFHQIVINCIMRYAFNKENLLQWGMAYLAIATISCLVGYATEKAEKQLVA